jgi:hypothetical protein
MPSELFFLRQFFSPNYGQVAMLVGLLLVAIYRPERICLLGLFRLSCVLLALSIVVTPVTTLVINMMSTVSNNSMARPGATSDLALLFSLMQVVEPILVALSIGCGLFSLLPSSRERSRSGPRQHPFDP